MKTQYDTLQKQHNELRDQFDDLELTVDQQEQYSRRMCLRISGITGDEGKPDENTNAKLLSMAAKYNIELNNNDIDKSHRVTKFKLNVSRPILVKFTNSSARQRVMDARKSLGPGVFVQEDITMFRQNLSYQARQLVRAKTLERTWIAGGRVQARLANSDKFLITCQNDIEDIKAGKVPSPKKKY